MATTRWTQAAPHQAPERPDRRLRAAFLYLGFWLLLGLALALADYQDPKWVPGREPWEPFFLEMGSVAVIGGLALLVYRWVSYVESFAGWWWRLLVVHLAGAAAFTLLHVGITYALRVAVYSALGLTYRTRDAWAILAYEAPKDLVTYALIAGLAYAWRLRSREAAQREQVERAKMELAELRLARLGDQLHPHFLFNCLNSIAALVEENPKAAVAMIARVGDFLRASLRDEAEPYAALGSELEAIRAYLAIQAVRFEDCIAAEFSVPPALEGAPVPRLVLQPLIENAVKHNMVRPDQPLRIEVGAARAGDGGLRITVANTRSGAAAANEGLGRGLDIVRSRLALLYGDRASLSVVDAGGQFTVTVALPPPAA